MNNKNLIQIQMKKIILTLAVTAFTAGTLITSCQSQAEKVKDAQAKVQDAQNKVVEAKLGILSKKQGSRLITF